MKLDIFEEECKLYPSLLKDNLFYCFEALWIKSFWLPLILEREKKRHGIYPGWDGFWRLLYHCFGGIKRACSIYQTVLFPCSVVN